MNRIELHTDTTYSSRLSFLSPVQIVRLCAKSGCQAVAITDRDSVAAYLDAEKEARQQHITLIHGLTLRCIDRDDQYDVTVLARNREGLHNLFRLFTLTETNRLPSGPSITRRQLETHRAGLLVGADGRDGQVVRAILHRRTADYVDAAAAGYDYLELPLEPYDVSAELFQASRRTGIPLCAIQNAVLSGREGTTAQHAFRAVSLHRKESASMARYLPPERLAQDFRELYLLPAERDMVDQALWDGPEQILAQIEDFPFLLELLDEGADKLHSAAMVRLRELAETALHNRFGKAPPHPVTERLALELEQLDAGRSAGGILLLYTAVQSAWASGGSVRVDGSGNSSYLLYLLGITEINPLPRFGCCTACRHWEDLTTDVPAPPVCPRCGSPWEVDGHALSPAAFLVQSSAGHHHSMEVRVSSDVLDQVRAALHQEFGAMLTESPMQAAEYPDTALVQGLVQRYIDRHPEAPELKGLLEDEEMHFYCSRFASPSHTRFGFSRWILLTEGLRDLLPILDGSWETPARLLLGSYIQAELPQLTLISAASLDGLQRCHQAVQVSPRDIPLDGPEVYQAIEDYILTGAGPASAPCALCGFPSSEFIQSVVRHLSVRDLPHLVRAISAVHSTGLWQGNLLPLLEQGALSPEQAPVCREDIYRHLAARGVSQDKAVRWMEQTRKGRFHADGYSEDDLAFLRSWNIEPWFVQLCKGVDYLFPEGHSMALALEQVRLVWYAVHFPETRPILAELAARRFQPKFPAFDSTQKHAD